MPTFFPSGKSQNPDVLDGDTELQIAAMVAYNHSLYTAQRSELTQLRDTDGDSVADEYLTVAKSWGVTGHYHEYAYGPKLDRDGNLWITLNIGLGLKGEELKRTIHEPTLKVPLSFSSILRGIKR